MGEHTTALQASELRYRRLFEAARDGILILEAETGAIVDANPFLLALTGYSREELLGRRLWEIGPFRNVAASRAAFITLQSQRYVRHDDLPLEGHDGASIDVEFVSNVYRVGDRNEIQCNIRDISAHKQHTDRDRLARAVLESLNGPATGATPIREILELIKHHTDIEAVGIRLRAGDDFPYFVTGGFSEAFVSAERSLCAAGPDGQLLRDGRGNASLECMCGTVLCGRADPALPFFTENGSFWTNSTTDLLASTTEEDRQSPTRNRCNKEGYESMALIPLRTGDEVLGLLQLNDRRRKRFSPELIFFLEGLGASIGIAVARRQAEQALRNGELRYRALLDASSDLIYVIDRGDTVTYVNSAALGALGRSAEEALGRPRASLFSTAVAAAQRPALEGIFATGEPLDHEYPLEVTAGGLRHQETRMIPLRGEDGEVDKVLCLSRDVTQRNRAEAALRSSEERHRVMFTCSRDATMTLTPPLWRFSSGNLAAIELFGARDEADFITRTPWEYSPAEQPDGRSSAQAALELIQTAMATGSHFTEWTHRRLDGALFPATVLLTRMEIGGQTLLHATVRDETAHMRAEATREELEKQLQTAQKLEAIGSLAGGIAHDFNNLLSVILSYTSFALEKMREGDPLRDDLWEVNKAGERAATLIRQLLAFSRKQVLQPVPLSLNQIAAGIEPMLRRILGEDIEFVLVLAPDLGVVLADPGQIEQVLVNLVVNARQSMPGGGKLNVETSNVDVEEEHAVRHMDLTPGPYVQLAVTDTGCGMDQQTKARIFEPFFSTKPASEGTGLGLSTVYGIIKQSGGNVCVNSEPGKGTTFKIYLPHELSATTSTATWAAAVPTLSSGTETILVIDDEEALCTIASRILAAAGFTVLTAADGDEALLICARHAGEIHLLLTDVVMPRMSGRKLAKAISAVRPAIKVLYMSGYTDNAILHHGVLDVGTHFLAKPFTTTGLARKVRAVLDGGRADLAAGHAPTIKPGAETWPLPSDGDATSALPTDLIDKLHKAINTARLDEIAELVVTLRIKAPALANSLAHLAELFDYDGMRELLCQSGAIGCGGHGWR